MTTPIPSPGDQAKPMPTHHTCSACGYTLPFQDADLDWFLDHLATCKQHAAERERRLAFRLIEVPESMHQVETRPAWKQLGSAMARILFQAAVDYFINRAMRGIKK